MRQAGFGVGIIDMNGHCEPPCEVNDRELPSFEEAGRWLVNCPLAQHKLLGEHRSCVSSRCNEDCQKESVMEEECSALEDCDKWIALYWTLSVPWARNRDRPDGHITLSEDADIAAQQSKTIQYQQALVRRDIKIAKRQLIGEVPYIDRDAFRPSDRIKGVLNRIAERCRAEGAGFVYVRFGGPYRVRYYAELENWVKFTAKRSGIKYHFVEAEGHDNNSESGQDGHETYQPKQHYSGLIDPFAHFRAWKAAGQERKDGSEQQIGKIIELVAELRSRGETFSQVATQLNSREIYSTTGRLWTAEGLRKFVKNNTEK